MWKGHDMAAWLPTLLRACYNENANVFRRIQVKEHDADEHREIDKA